MKNKLTLLIAIALTTTQVVMADEANQLDYCNQMCAKTYGTGSSSDLQNCLKNCTTCYTYLKNKNVVVNSTDMARCCTYSNACCAGQQTPDGSPAPTPCNLIQR